jgi:hypothetical protein
MPKTPNVSLGEPLFADTVNELQNNLSLKIGMNAYAYDGGLYSTNSQTYVNMDGTNLNKSFNTKGNDFLIAFSCSMYTNFNGTEIYIRLLIDGVEVLERRTKKDITTHREVHPIYYLAQGYSAGAHTVTIQWRVNQAAQGSTDIVTFFIMEF